MDRIELNVTINGTDMNPWHRLGLRQNPFPQIGKAEYAASAGLASLDGDPGRTADDIPPAQPEVDRVSTMSATVRQSPFPGGRNTAEPSGEVQVGDLVSVGEAALTVERAGWAPLRGGITEVRLDEHGTHPLPADREAPASGQPAGTGEGDDGT